MNIQVNLSKIILIMVFFAGIISCEQDLRTGEGIIGDTPASSNVKTLALSASTLAPDTIRSDKGILSQLIDANAKLYYGRATLGVYNDPLFGKVKSDFYTQVRLSVLSPNFRENPTVDSVVLRIPAAAFNKNKIDSTSYLAYSDYTLKQENGDCQIIDTINHYHKRYTYALDSLYGNKEAKMKLKVYEVTQNLGSVDSLKFSNKSYQTGALLGEAQISKYGYINSVITSSGAINASGFKEVKESNLPAYYVNLNGMKDLVQNKILNGNRSDLTDQISFVNNVIKGIKLTVENEDGFIYTFSPNEMEIKIYYKFKNPNFKDADGDGIHDGEENCGVVATRKQIRDVYSLAIGFSKNNPYGQYNTYQNHIKNENGAVPLGAGNNIYLEGMGGNKVKLSLDANEIQALRDSVKLRNWAITEAKIKVFPNMEAQGMQPLPEYLYLYNYTKSSLLPGYGGKNTSQESGIQAIPFSQMSEKYSYKNGYYTLRVTEFIKNIVEGNAPIDELALNVGNYLNLNNSYYFKPKNAFYSNQVFNPFHLVGYAGKNTTNQEKRLRLEVVYTKR